MFVLNRSWVDMSDGFDDPGIDRLVWGITGEKPDASARPAPTAPTAAPSPDLIAESTLYRHAAEELIGRNGWLRRLDTAWEAPATHLLSIVAWGGVGKTALVAEWISRFARRNWQGVGAYFDWTFYSQGTRRQGSASADLFIQEALQHFGDPDPTGGSPADRGRRLARLVSVEDALLVLDGLEPLQYGPGPLEGQLKDPALAALLQGLAHRPFGGLCVTTSRENLTDLAAWRGGTVEEQSLDLLGPAAGAALLHRLGVRRAGAARIEPDDAELKKAAKEVDGHCLTLQLMGRYLARHHGGDVRRRDALDLGEAEAEFQPGRREADRSYGHAFKALQAYEVWLEGAGEEGRRELAVLRLMGLFDRPASAGCLEALRDEPPIEGLTDPLVGLRESDWNAALNRLAGLDLITVRETADPTEAPVDAHPLVREYFAHRLREENEEAWREGHRRLYEHLTGSADRHPDTLAGLQPLYAAVAHGCEAGREQEACVEVYRDRILRGTGSGGNYSTFQLGAIGADLGAVACFFEEPWTRPSPNLSESDQAWLLNDAAFSLRALGRLTEAREPMRATLEINVEATEWKNAAVVAGNLSELELTLGEVAGAVREGERSVEFADRSGDEFQRYSKRTTHADALHQAGRHQQARALFEEAEAMQAERQPGYPRLYSLQGFQYCDLLLAGAERAAWLNVRRSEVGGQRPETAERRAELVEVCREVEARGKEALEIVLNGSRNLLDIALNHLTLARAGIYREILGTANVEHRTSNVQRRTGRDERPTDDGEPPGPAGSVTVEEEIEAAVDGLRRAGTTHHVPRGLLTRALFRHLRGDPEGGRADLEEARRIAQRGPMRLHLADVHLDRARLLGDPDALERAAELIEQTGYGRREEEVENAREMSNA